MKTSTRLPIVYKSITALMLGLDMPKPKHPLIALVNYDVSKPASGHAGQSFLIDLYKISFKKKFTGKVKYGRGHYGFEEGGMAFLSPNQLVTMPDDPASQDGYTLYFHFDMIRNYALGKNIQRYGFFAYAVDGALLLSEKERTIMSGLFDNIAAELDDYTDDLSTDVIVSQIELLLNYSNRFYERQFQTRRPEHTDLVMQMNRYLNERFDGHYKDLSGCPTVQEVADHMQFTPRYLNDMLKSLSGKNTQQHIHDQLIEKAKMLLCTGRLHIAEIAYQLGFEHPQSFNKLFKRQTTLSPTAYRKSFTEGRR